MFLNTTSTVYICKKESPCNNLIKLIVSILAILTGKKHRQLKLWRLQKVRVWTIGSLIHQIASL